MNVESVHHFSLLTAPYPRGTETKREPVSRLYRIFEEEVRPQLLAGARIGRPVVLDVRQMLDEEGYLRMAESLDTLSGSLPRLLLKGPSTHYWRMRREGHGMSWHRSWNKVLRFRRLLNSLATNGFLLDAARPVSLPWVFLAPQITLRINGNHRACAWRYLGNRDVPVLAMTPGDLLDLEITDRDFIEELRREPPFRGSPYAPPRPLPLDKNVFLPDLILRT